VRRWYGYLILLVDAGLLAVGYLVPTVGLFAFLLYFSAGAAFHASLRARVRWKIVCAVISASNRGVGFLAGVVGHVLLGPITTRHEAPLLGEGPPWWYWLVPMALASLFDALALGWRTGAPLPPGDRRWYGFLLAPVDLGFLALYLAVGHPVLLALFAAPSLVHLLQRVPPRRVVDSLVLRVGTVSVCVAILALCPSWRSLVPLALIATAALDAIGLAVRSVSRLPVAVVIR
jgi:hypothetical protein